MVSGFRLTGFRLTGFRLGLPFLQQKQEKQPCIDSTLPFKRREFLLFSSNDPPQRIYPPVSALVNDGLGNLTHRIDVPLHCKIEQHMKQIFSLIALIFLLASCDDGSKKQMDALKKETMDVHDEAMKDLADMNRTSRKLKEHLTVAVMTPEQSEQFTAALAAIEKADDEMTAWMSSYEDPEGATPAEAIRYLQEQKQKMEKNRDDIRAALAAGKKLLPQEGK